MNFPSFASKLVSSIATFQGEFNFINTPEKMPTKIKHYEMDEEWKEHCQDNPDTFWYTGSKCDIKQYVKPEYHSIFQKYLDLRDKILTFGGTEVCTPYQFFDGSVDIIKEYGQFWYNDNIEVLNGRVNGCHDNSYDYWMENKEKGVFYCNGYYLSDGMWRSHSWCIDKNNKIIETTRLGEAYYGVVIPHEFTKEFYEL
jgi:hypothetical protein